MKHVLLTGFEPFGGDAINPSWEVARALSGELLGSGALVHARQLPCVFGQSLQQLLVAAQAQPWDVVLCLGLAANRANFSLERVAINVDDARIPDNAGQQPVDVPVCPGAPSAHFSTLPIKRMAAALQGVGLPAEVSQTAGTYVCNHVFFGLMQWATTQATPPTPPRCGFMHLPPFSVQGLEAQVRAVRLALAVALEGEGDLALPGGALS